VAGVVQQRAVVRALDHRGEALQRPGLGLVVRVREDPGLPKALVLRRAVVVLQRLELELQHLLGGKGRVGLQQSIRRGWRGRQ
jgi:hypothetical protein